MNQKPREQHEFWDQHFDDVSPTAPQPTPSAQAIKSYTDIFDQELKALKSVNPHIYAQIVKGRAMGNHSKLVDEDYIYVLHTVIKCIFQCLREDVNERVEVLEDRQEELIKLTSAEGVFLSGLEVLKTMKIKLDINLVYAIIHGYIGQCISIIVKDYEHTRSIKH